MALRRSTIGEVELAFDAISIEGGLLGADWLGRVAQLEATAQTPADYRVPKGLQIRDEIARSWRIAQACFQDMEASRAVGGDADILAERFVEALLRDAFGFASLARAEPRTIGETAYPVRFFALGDRVPVVVAPVGVGLDAPRSELGDGRRRRSAFGLLQEVLNASGAALWGLASDALSLRVARDNASLTRPAWIQADLARIFTERLYPDFAALWLLVHESRFGRADDLTPTSPLETWREAGREEGTVARDKLSAGFEQALEILGQAFLAHAANTKLRSALHSGELTKDRYFGQLLRLVYRLIFLLTVEERDLLHPKSASNLARQLYTEGYALRRLRDRAIRRSAHDHQGDLWDAVKVVFRGLATGQPSLGLPALAGLFAEDQCADLDAAKIENRALLSAVFHLAWLREPAGLVRVNWRDMGPDELGYVYEGLLELVPQIMEDGRSFSFASADESRGHARKMTGSYYTPDELVRLLLASALDPVVKRTVDAHPDRPVDAILELSIVDPACGSGHFLLAAARRLADEVARIRAAGTPSPEDYQRALRDVVRRCIYGVDMNPLAVELCKVSLWMESVDPGLPLTFLESHIRCGNSLIGTTRALMEARVPDAAWVPLEGDDKKVVSALRKRNREEATGHQALPFEEPRDAGGLREAIRSLERAPDSDLLALGEKERQWKTFLSSQAYEREKLVADAWCAAFLWPKEKAGAVVEAAPTTAKWLALRDNEAPPSGVLVEMTRRIAEDYGLFHWDLAFPHVFARAGFDVVLGNPPWEHLELKEQEFFAKRDPSIAEAQNAAIRKGRIAALPATNPDLWGEWQLAKRRAQGEMHFARASGRFPLSARGRINTYPLFAELNWRVLGTSGRAGFIVPSGIATDDTTKEYFQALVDRRALASIHHFENEDLVFKGLHHAYRFVLITIGASERTDLAFYLRRAVDLDDEARHFSLTSADFATLNPNTRTCPTFRSRRDADINLAIYRRTGVLWREDDPDGNPWGLRLMQGLFNMASDSGLFRTRPELAAAGWKLDGNRFVRDGEVLLPLYEAKMIHLFDHRFGTYDGQTEAQANQGKLPEVGDTAHANPRQVSVPRYWVTQADVEARLDNVWDRGWLLGWRDITGTEKIRTVIVSVIPRVGVGHKMPLAFPSTDATRIAALYANLCSFALDYAARQKVGGLSLTFFVLKQLPVLLPSAYSADCPWDRVRSIREWLLPRVLELTYTACDLRPFAEDCGDEGPPYIWDGDRRFQLQCEIDAAFFYLYGVSARDAAYILDSFPVLARAEERDHGEYRTKRTILNVYDALAAAAAAGRPYVSPLAPPRRAT